jgi:hypothetical protein
MKKLSKKREAEIRQLIADYQLHEAKSERPPLPQLATTYAPELLAELDRIRPRWAKVEEGSHRAGFTYFVAGTTAKSDVPVYIGKAVQDEGTGTWIDYNSKRPFPTTTTVTHYFWQRSPTELIGQPDAD